MVMPWWRPVTITDVTVLPSFTLYAEKARGGTDEFADRFVSWGLSKRCEILNASFTSHGLKQ
jgi:hypothetical protein